MSLATPDLPSGTCDLSILVVNWNTNDLLAGCLKSLASKTWQVATCHLPPVTSEYIVVDNASTDGSAAMVRERFPAVQLIENQQNVGFARANNQAICHSRGRYVLLLNSDTVVHGGALAAMVAFMETHPEAGGCGPRLLNGDGSLQPSVHPMLTPWREFWRLSFLDRLWPLASYRQETWDTTIARPVEVIKGACLLLRRAALDQVGLLDDRYFMYTEEVDLCYRLARAGWQLWYLPQAEVTHFGEASSKQVRQDMYLQLYRSKVQFFRKFGGVARSAWYKFLLALAYLPRAVLMSVGSLLHPAWQPQARLFRRLLLDLSRF